MIYKLKPKDILSLSELINQLQESKIVPDMILIDTDTHELSIEIAPIVLGISED